MCRGTAGLRHRLLEPAEQQFSITFGAFLVTSGNGTFVPRIVLIRGCRGRIPAPE